MKKNLFAVKATKMLLVIFIGCLACLRQGYAQVYVPASTTESLLVSNEVQLNSAMIDYTPNCTAGGGCGNAQLKAVSWAHDNTIGAAQVIVDDGLGGPVTITLPANSYFPDVIIGNNNIMATDYLLGAVYMQDNGLGQYAIYVDVYDIGNVGTGSSLTSSLSGSYQLTGYGTYSYPRIDVIAEYGNIVSGLPVCDKFAISYFDITAGISTITGYASSLNNPISGIYKTLRTGIAPFQYYEPDVAAIQRYHHGKVTTVDDVALFTYFIPGGDLYYQEWDITQNTISIPLTLDTPSTGDTIGQFPKIDAIDDYHINDPTIGSPLAYYTVVDRLSNSGVETYNNYLPIPGGLDISSALFMGNTTSLPVVAAGPCGQYTVAYPASYMLTTNIIAENIDWTTGYPVGYSGGFTFVDFYQVSMNPGTGEITASATCNGNSTSYAPNLLVAWNGVGSSDVYEKVTDCSMYFKSTSVSNIAKSADWTLSPNPATDMVVITNSNVAQGNTYSIVDITGRVLQHADVDHDKQQVDISQFAPGMYMLNIYNNGKEIKTMKFVKE